MAWLGGAIGMGIVVGPALGGFLSFSDFHLKYRFFHFAIDGFTMPFFVAALLSILTLGAAVRWLPEPFKKTCNESSVQLTGITNVPKLKPSQFFISRWLWPFLLLAFLNQFALSTFEGTFALHAKHLTLFGPWEMGIVLLICGFVMAAAQPTVVVWLIARFGEKPLLPAGFALEGIALATLMTTPKLGFIALYVALFAFGVALINPSLNSLVSMLANNRQGVVLGQLIAAGNLGQASGPFLGALLFAWQIHAPYLMTSILLLSTAAYWAKYFLTRHDEPLRKMDC